VDADGDDGNRFRWVGVSETVIVRTLLLLPALLALLGCQAAATPTPTASSGPTLTPPSSPATGLTGIIADLTAAGVTAVTGGSFMSEPIGGEGVALCVGVETVQTYAFIDHEAALAAAAKIDRDDPSKIGTGIVDWAGTPRFWLRNNIILLYLGPDPATDAALRSLLGPPFAEGQPGRPPLPWPPCT
jgi:hypothetical protein